MTSAPNVSVIIPMRDAAATIADALESVRAQEGATWEAIVMDDGSRDDSAAIVASMAAADPRIRLEREFGRGPAAARNRALALARGEFISFLDADDALLPGAFRILMQAIRPRGAAFPPAAHGAYGAAEWCDAEGRSLGFTYEASCPMVSLAELRHAARFQPAAQLISREALGDLRFREHLRGVEDYDLFLRLAERGVRWRAVYAPVCRYRLRDASLSRDYARQAEQLVTMLAESFRRAPADAEDGPAARTVLLRAVLDEATAAAFADVSPRADAAADVLRRGLEAARETGHVLVPPLIDGKSAAASAFWKLPYAACLAPNAWSEDDIGGFVDAAHRFWSRLLDDGFAQPTLIDDARWALAPMTVQPADVARRLIAPLDRNRPVVLLGLGRNAAHVVRALTERGFADIHARDDAFDPAGGEVRIAGSVVRVLPRSRNYLAADQHVMTPHDDRAYVAKLPPGLTIHLWSRTQRSMADRAHDRLMEAWPIPSRARRRPRTEAA